MRRFLHARLLQPPCAKKQGRPTRPYAKHTACRGETIGPRGGAEGETDEKGLREETEEQVLREVMEGLLAQVQVIAAVVDTMLEQDAKGCFVRSRDGLCYLMLFDLFSLGL